MKAWFDDIEGIGRASLDLALDGVGKVTNHWFKTESWAANRALPWTDRSWEEDADPTITRFDKPSMVPFENVPDLGEEPKPDFWEVRISRTGSTCRC